MKSSRRILLRTLAALAVLPSAWRARAQAKASKEAMKYQDQPKGDQTCDTCQHWIPGPKPDAPGQCKVVEGTVNPKGWCAAWVKKS